MLPYKKFITPLNRFISAPAFNRLLKIKRSFLKNFAPGRDIQFIDSIVVFEAFGKISIPRERAHIKRDSGANFYHRVNDNEGFAVSLPSINGEHPFAHPEDDQEFIEAIHGPRQERAQEFTDRLILIHEELRAMLLSK